mmetsp:Transcript_83762/g.221872  ORF Transcript_83762/g.221872 Transcript_83762/m.221872 type:complete len:325 (-) Transcript_83762:16-990(-)
MSLPSCLFHGSIFARPGAPELHVQREVSRTSGGRISLLSMRLPATRVVARAPYTPTARTERPPTSVIILGLSSRSVLAPLPRPPNTAWIWSSRVLRSSAARARISRSRTSTFSRSCEMRPSASALARAMAVSRSSLAASPIVRRFSSSNSRLFFFRSSSWRTNWSCCIESCWSICFCWSSSLLWYSSLSSRALYSAVLLSCSFWWEMVFRFSSASSWLLWSCACVRCACCCSICACSSFCFVCSASFVTSKAFAALGELSSSFSALAPRSSAVGSNLPVMFPPASFFAPPDGYCMAPAARRGPARPRLGGAADSGRCLGGTGPA